MKTLDEYLKKPYRMNIKEDKDEGGYVVFFPNFPGVSLAAKQSKVL